MSKENRRGQTTGWPGASSTEHGAAAPPTQHGGALAARGQRGGAFQAQTASLPEAPRSRPNQRRPPGHAAETLGTGAEGTAPAAEAGPGPTRCCPPRWHPPRGPPVTSAKAPLPLGASSPAGDSRQTCEARATEEGRVARERPGSHRSHRSRYFYDTKKKITSISFLFPTSVL